MTMLRPLPPYEPPLSAPTDHRLPEEQHVADATDNEEDLTPRQIGAELYDFAMQIMREDDRVSAEELAKRTRSERLAEAQVMALQAIYRELQHGHDQAQKQTKALLRHAKVMEALRADLRDHAAAMEKSRGALSDHTDALIRYRRHE
ncbi:hypothetical protein [Saccharomonospora azurea]|uniref:hypothetical protein n=1 Tax=Saccharomonospora azurea TaxID=40988 RepID=UPI001147A42E|nr:hypothetical protein [Saccharomonospora azurea]